ncbi:flavin monoamine oxidase family protein [Hyphobacterium sp.]|uniref:flavin monoamine oxidase family protein n=1 Tax=Hyphobacterium sp. TaxID=2004662 RepID=UPI003BAC29EA
MQTDVLIVGGGLSGLSLADRLERDGRDWQLLEASDRLGGRIYSLDIQGQKFDLGPAWFWHGQPRIAQMIERVGLKPFEQYSSGAIQIQDRSGEVRSHQGFSPMQGSMRLGGGMVSLIEALAGMLPVDRIHRDHPVSQLTKSANGIVARFEHGSIQANQAVLAIPPRLAASTLKFEPALPEAATKAMAATATWMAGQAKFIAAFDRPFWREAGYSGDALSQRGPLVEIHDASPAENGPYALFGFVDVPANVRAANRARLVEMAKGQLVDLFGEELSHPLEVALQDWAQVSTIATLADRNGPGHHPTYGYPYSLRDLFDGRLIFGASEMGNQFGGFLEGAIESAEQAHALLREPANPGRSGVVSPW